MCAEWSIWGCTISLRLRCIWGKMLTGPKEEEEGEGEGGGGGGGCERERERERMHDRPCYKCGASFWRQARIAYTQLIKRIPSEFVQ
jgi:hypothetical protein